MRRPVPVTSSNESDWSEVDDGDLSDFGFGMLSDEGDGSDEEDGISSGKGDGSDEEVEKSLHRASKRGHEESVRVLLGHRGALGVDVNLEQGGRTPLHWAIMGGTRRGGEATAGGAGDRRQPGGQRL